MFKHTLFAIIAALTAALAAVQQAKAAEPRSVEVEDTEFKVTLTDGQVLRSAELVRATLTINTTGGLLRLRIDAVERDPDATRPPVWLHSFSTEAPDGSWQNLCTPARTAGGKAFRSPSGPLPTVRWSRPSRECSSWFAPEARGKCVRFGYPPWAGDAMRDVYNACVRMVRADYCGDGEGTTRNGTLIDHYDAEGIEESAHDSRFEFEAGWTAAGAVCVRRVRIKENTSLEQLAASCPRLRDRLGASCTEESARVLGATVFVRSLP
jgi:hypothetical protein